MDEKEKLSNNAKSTPNKKLYIILLVIALSIIAISIFISKEWTLFTIVSGIGCGGVASVIVAWLIDEANYNRDKQRSTRNKEIIFQRLEDVFDHDLQIIISDAIKRSSGENEDSEITWIEWIKFACQTAKSSEDKEIKECFCCLYLLSLIDSIERQVKVFYDQTALLLELNIIDEKAVSALSSIIGTCDSLKRFNELTKEDYDSKIVFSLSSFENIYQQMESTDCFCSINHRKIRAYLYNYVKVMERLERENRLIKN